METISKPEEQLKLVHHLSDMDQSVPRDYARRMFIFDFPDRTRRAEATSALRRGLETAFKAYPHLTGLVGPDDTKVKERDLVTLRYGGYRKKAAGFYSYRELCHMNMPVSHWKTKDFCIAPMSWKNEDWVPAVTLKATFLGSGGLVLCFAFHNAVADGRSITMFIETLAKGIRDSSAINEINAYIQPRDLAESCEFDLKEMPHLWDEGRFPGLDFDKSKPVYAYPHSGRSRLIKFPAEAIAELKDQCLAYVIGALNADEVYLSTADVLSALVWPRRSVHHDRRPAPAGLGRRGAPDYFGNASMNVAVATMAIRNLVHPETTECPGNGAARLAPATLSTIATCADQIRQSLLLVEPDTIEDRLALYTTLEKPLDASVASRRAIQSHKYGVRVGSLADAGGADIDFGIPGTGAADGRARFVRKPWAMENGLVNILPRRRGSGDDWVVLVGADSAVLDQLCSNRELGRWASGFVDDQDPSLWWERRFGARRLPDEEDGDDDDGDDSDGDVKMN
ncbi:hypothetical protein PG996_002377 [Apiospora saccharicola]|uniref:Uncharacterized protein n=1 Tax=Apiospora saccharicola TaxID=335842 RepID=A0ABR1WJB9_9PEZI